MSPCSIGCYFRTERQAGASLFLTETRFRILGRLAGEYVVGMFFRTEDERNTFAEGDGCKRLAWMMRPTPGRRFLSQ
jgi:hypothetical protein